MDKTAQPTAPQNVATPQSSQKFVANNTPPPVKSGSKLNVILLTLFVILLLAVGIGGFYFFVFNKSAGQNLDSNQTPNQSSVENQTNQSPTTILTPTITLTPTPTRAPIAQGPQTYKVGGLSNGVNIPEVWFSTIDPGAGYQQIKVSLTDTGHKVTSVTAEVKTDKLDNSYPLTLSSGDGTSGDWTGQWTVKGDTYNNNFQVYLFIKDDASNTTPTIITIR